MAAPALAETNGSTFSFGGSTGQTCTFGTTPSADEIVILAYMGAGVTTAATSFSWGTGFTQFANDFTNDVQLAAAWKRAGGSESASYSPTWTAGSGGNERTIGFRFTGCITSGSPIDDSGVDTTSFPGSSFTAGNRTATVAETRHVLLLCSTGNLNSPAITGYAETVYNQSFGGSSFAMDARAAFNDDIVSSGSTGSKTISASSGFFNVTVVSFLLLPAAAATTSRPFLHRNRGLVLRP